MFDKLFDRPHAVKRHCSSPLAEERSRYLDHLAQQGMARGTLRNIALGWVLTLPAAMLLSGTLYAIFRLVF